MKNKIRKISLGRYLYLSLTEKYLVVGRPFRRRHISIEETDGKLVAHLTDERLGTHKHLATLKLSALQAYEQRLGQAAAEAFFDNLHPVTADELAENHFRLLAPKSFGLSFARLVLKPRRDATLRLRAPSEKEIEGLAQQLPGRLVDSDQLESFVNAPPGSISAVHLDGDHFISFPLYHLPRQWRHMDGRVLEPGWYFMSDRECLVRAQSQVLLDFDLSKILGTIDRALRFLRISVDISPVEIEDTLRRHAAGESFEEIRASREG